MKHFNYIFYGMLVCLLAGSAMAQAQTISGQVIGDDGIPLIGVSILAKETSSGVVTDIDGNYSLTPGTGAETLVFSYTGFASQEVPIAGRTTIDVTLSSNAEILDEVVVVGYGTQKARSLVSAVSKIDEEAIERTPSASFTDALQGAASGLQVSAASGEPNSATRILIRGVGSISTSAEPLFIVDGVQVASGGTSPLNYLAPQDIESISVLKDAAATSIYGSRGSNGVILITTKTGKKGQRTVNFGYERGFTEPINEVEPADADQFRTLVNRARENSGLATDYDPSIQLEDIRQRDRYNDLGVYDNTNTDWVDELQRNGTINQYNLSASAGTDRTTFYISGQYRNQEGNFGLTEFERYTGRVNLDFDATDYLKVGMRYTYAQLDDIPRNAQQSNTNPIDRNQNFGAWPSFGRLYNQALPVNPVSWSDDGSYFDPLSGNNLVAGTDRDLARRDVTNRTNQGNIYAELTPINNLRIRGELGLDRSNVFDYNWISGALRYDEYNEEELMLEEGERLSLDRPYNEGVARFRWTDNTFTTYNYTATAQYDLSLKEIHDFTFLTGVEAINSTSDNYEYDFEDVGAVRRPEEVGSFIRQPEQFIQLSHTGGAETRFFSTFGRLNYSLNDKYLFQASLRRDGSSKFTPEDRFSLFPSVSAGWVISDEGVIPEGLPISFLKIRGGWGVTGNANIGSFLFLNGFAQWPNFPNRPRAGVLTRLGSNTIQWERNSTYDVALDFGLFENRISGSVGYYRSETSNLLLNFPVAPSVGLYGTNNVSVTALDNVGALQNQGIELELRTVNMNRGKFKWESTLNFTTNNNEVTELYPGFDGDPRQLSFSGVTTVQIGEPLGTFFLPEFAGYDESGNTLIREIDQDLSTNEEPVFTGNNIRNVGNAGDANSVIQYGKTGLPTYFGGLNNQFTYGGLSLGVQFTFQGGNYIYDNIGLYSAGVGNRNFRADVINNSWTPQNTDARYPALSWNDVEINPEGGADAQGISGQTNNFLEKGDFIRLRNINLSYNLPGGLFANNFLRGVRVYTNLTNVATITGFDHFDPEVVNNGNAQERNLGQGVVGGVPYWQVFTATFGVNVSL